MFTAMFLTLTLAGAEPQWHTDYDRASRQAIREKKDLVIYFRDADNRLADVWRDAEVRELLKKFVCLELPADFKYDGQRLLDHGALVEMMGRPGLVVVSYHNKSRPFYQEVVSAHPFVGSHYHWVPNYGTEEVKVILALPPEATLTQRSMIYAVTVHPERPRSIRGRLHLAFLNHARRHSTRQAQMRYQHHADILAAWGQLNSEVGQPIGGPSEVVAESWGMVLGGENVLEASFSCVDAWRHSSGHWGAVSREHSYFGYDIARGDNGTWYATGIFAD